MIVAQIAREVFDDWSPAAKLIGCLAMVAIAIVAIMVSGEDDK